MGKFLDEIVLDLRPVLDKLPSNLKARLVHGGSIPTQAGQLGKRKPNVKIRIVVQ